MTVRRATTPVRVLAVRPDHTLEKPDDVVTEEPMEIRAGGPGTPARAVAVTMRTPGHDFELAAGFLFGEGLIGPGDILHVRYCDLAPGTEQEFNVVTVDLHGPFLPPDGPRGFAMTSSCGTCGKATIDQVELACPTLPPSRAGLVTTEVIAGLPRALRSAQPLFSRTGGLHAAGLFTTAGVLELLREDVGRHNAVDKVVGRAVLDGLVPLGDRVLMLSGRVSFEIVQKAAMAGIPVVCAVSAPSSLAVRAADRLGVTVVGFVREGSCNVYSHPDRVTVTV